MAPAVDRANRDTARRTAEKLVGFLTERYELRLKDVAGRRAGRPGPDGRRPVDDAEAAQHGRS
jgi:hypothetical protein